MERTLGARTTSQWQQCVATMEQIKASRISQQCAQRGQTQRH